MLKLNNLVAAFRKDESGAAMVEYTIITGLITLAVITAVGAVGGFVSGQWTTIQGLLGV